MQAGGSFPEPALHLHRRPFLRQRRTRRLHKRQRPVRDSSSGGRGGGGGGGGGKRGTERQRRQPPRPLSMATPMATATRPPWPNESSWSPWNSPRPRHAPLVRVWACRSLHSQAGKEKTRTCRKRRRQRSRWRSSQDWRVWSWCRLWAGTAGWDSGPGQRAGTAGWDRTAATASASRLLSECNRRSISRLTSGCPGAQSRGWGLPGVLGPSRAVPSATRPKEAAPGSEGRE